MSSPYSGLTHASPGVFPSVAQPCKVQNRNGESNRMLCDADVARALLIELEAAMCTLGGRRPVTYRTGMWPNGHSDCRRHLTVRLNGRHSVKMILGGSPRGVILTVTGGADNLTVAAVCNENPPLLSWDVAPVEFFPDADIRVAITIRPCEYSWTPSTCPIGVT
jgi:hypothetical protein